jgi:RHS repeat-associated protein
VTDPAGKWKTFTTDALGNMTTVVEPDPANPTTATLTTSYAYDWMNHVTQVTMTRGATTQTRTFVYDNLGRLTSATNPENGAGSYVYNTDGTNTLQYKHDAKGQDTVYTYDSKLRVTMVQKYPTGKNNVEDLCQRVTYTWDTASVAGFTSYNALNRLGTVTYGGDAVHPCFGNLTKFAEAYSYTAPGPVSVKRLQVTRYYLALAGYDPDTGDPYYNWMGGTSSLDATYQYNSHGQVSAVTYPFKTADPYGTLTPSPTFTYGFDNMGRPTSLADNSQLASLYPSQSTSTWVQNVQYDYASRMTSLQYLRAITDSGDGPGYTYNTQTMSYNVNRQLASLGFSGGVTGSVQYNYSATQNNGQITQAVDSISGETISYQYDALKRLVSASSTPNAGSSVAAWNQTYQFDGFGNLTQKTVNGTAYSLAVNAATNQLSSAVYDANGNTTSGAGATMAYDVANRMVSAQTSAGGIEYYGYAPDNKQVYRRLPSGTGATNLEITFYGAMGEKLGVFGPTYTWNPSAYTWNFALAPIRSNVYFAGKMIWSDGTPVYQDRLGTNRANGARFYPYGDEITSTSNDREKFGTYTRDAYTGLDYADQRFYANTYGRFDTPDRSRKGIKYRNPESWNKYIYSNDDPVNNSDPSGKTCVQQFGKWADDGTGCSYVGDPVSDWGSADQSAAGIPQVSSTITFPPCTEPCGDVAINPTGAAIVQATGQLLSSVSVGGFISVPLTGSSAGPVEAGTAITVQIDSNSGVSKTTDTSVGFGGVTFTQSVSQDGGVDKATTVSFPPDSPINAGATISTESGYFGFEVNLGAFSFGGYLNLGGGGGGAAKGAVDEGFDQ